MTNFFRLSLILAIIIIIVTSLNRVQIPFLANSFEQTLYQQFDHCAKLKGSTQLKQCFAKTIFSYVEDDPYIMPKLSAVLDKYTDDKKSDLDYMDVHTILHDIGMLLYYKFEGDPKKAFIRCGVPFDGGCYHAVIMTYADEIKDSEYDLKKILFNICYSPQLQEADQKRPACFHGAGHVSIYKHKGDLIKALADCDIIYGQRAQDQCYDGVFMEYSKGQSQLGVHSHQSVGSIPLPCQTIPSKYQPICFVVLGRNNPAFLGNRNNFLETAQVCEQSGEFKFDCFVGMTKKIIFRSKKDFSEAKKICNTLPKNSASLCQMALLHNTLTIRTYAKPFDRFTICDDLSGNLNEKCRLANQEYLKFIYAIN